MGAFGSIARKLAFDWRRLFGSPDEENRPRLGNLGDQVLPPDHHRRALEALQANPPDYNRYHANIAASYRPVTGRKVLVVGCNRGEDCRYFLEFSAAGVVGLDVLDEIGANVRHERLIYVRASVEDMPLTDNSIDLAYCFATMEHVPDIERAFRELARVCRSGGVIYSVAAPLWNTRQGPHWGSAFDDYPWIHLRLTRPEIIAFSERRRQERPTSKYLTPSQLEYMTDARYFNKRPARDYLAACAALTDVECIRNDIEEEEDTKSDVQVVEALVQQGFDRRELFGLTHTFVARKL